MKELKLITVLGALGYGVDEDALEKALSQHEIDLIGVDGGSNDSGPGNFGGSEEIGRSVDDTREDLRKILKARDQIDVPLVIGSAGVSGVKQHVDRVVDIVKGVADEEDLSFKLGKIYTDIDDGMLKSEIDDGNISQIVYDKKLTKEDVDNAENIVGMIGHEPFVEAMDCGADVILSGRSLDISPFAALPLSEGFDRGLSYHLGKLLECGGNALEPNTIGGGMIGVIRDDHFDVVPIVEEERATIESVAGQALHEKTNPYEIYVPSGKVDISQSEFEQVTDDVVRVSNSEFVESNEYSVLMEGVEKIGYRSLTVAGVPDPRVYSNIESILEAAEEYFQNVNVVSEEKFQKRVRVFGSGESDIFDSSVVDQHQELGLVIEVVGETQHLANEVCKTFNNSIRKVHYEGKINKGGNIALSMSASPGKELPAGPVYEWSVNHLLNGVSSMEIADINIEKVGMEVVADN
jgi:hypothetical protein